MKKVKQNPNQNGILEKATKLVPKSKPLTSYVIGEEQIDDLIKNLDNE